jgi:cytoskeletal protein CcmA (bactofilin family)
MWNKREEGNAPRSIPETPTRTVVASPPAGAPASRGMAIVGASMQIKGEIRSREELLVEGEVEGIVESQSLVTIGPNGKVKANIRAREVSIQGAVRGNIEVTEKIAIRDKGSLIGDIKTAGISIDDGAYFKGSIDIVRPEPRQGKVTVLSEPAAAGD